MNSVTNETLQLIKKAQAEPSGELAKAYVQAGGPTTGLTYYDLEGPAKQLYPVMTPLRNSIPRVSGKGGIQANWRAITGVNTSKAGPAISEGNRGQTIAQTTQDFSAVYRQIGLDNYVTFEAELAGNGFEDVKARAVEGLLHALMIGEEMLLLGGNGSQLLGATPTPAGTASTSGGSLATNTVRVFCVALTLEGLMASSVAGGLPLSGNRTLADGTVEPYNAGTAQKSAVGSFSVTGPTGSIAASVTAVVGAVAYAWFWGTSGNELLGAITTINSILIAADATGAQNISAGFAADYSKNSISFDGLLTIANTSGSNAYVKRMAAGTSGTGTPLTSDNAGGIVEIDAALQSFWDTYRLSPTEILVSSQEMNNIGKKILAGNSSAAQRFVFEAKQGMVAGGIVVRSYLNKFTMVGMSEIPLSLHPNLPAGTLLFKTDRLPYPLSNVSNVMQVRTRKEYHQIEWPLKTRKYEYGVYADEVLQHYAPFSLGLITNIGNG